MPPLTYTFVGWLTKKSPKVKPDVYYWVRCTLVNKLIGS